MDFLVRRLQAPWAVGVLLGLCAFSVYRVTLSPTVNFIDSGELAAVACTLGIAHPTGYPLFTLLGWLWSNLPVGSEPIFRLNLMAAFFCSVGIFLFSQILIHLLSVVSRRSAALRPKGKGQVFSAILVASSAASLLLAFSETYWKQALSVEVYSLHLLFVPLVLLTFFRATIPDDESQGVSDGRTSRAGETNWYLFALLLGLSFTNHMTTILLLPATIYFYFATQENTRVTWQRGLLMVFPFLLGLSVYLYLPLRALQAPTMNWGNPVTMERFLWHLTGKQYRVWIFSSTDAAGRQFSYFLSSLPGEMAFVGLLLALIGVVVLWKAHRKLLLMTLILFLTCVAYSINYDIHDIDSYFLLAYLVLALWAGIGSLALYAWIRNVLRWGSLAASLAVITCGLVPLAYHYARVDESRNRLVEDYTMNMFSSLRPQALVLSYQWDYWVSASYYYQLVAGMRPDLVVIDKELLRRSWYLTELDRRFPRLMRESSTEVEAFRKELHKFEHDLPYDAKLIQARFVQMIRSFIRRSMPSRQVYVTGEIEAEFTEGLQRVPEGLAFRLVPDTLFHAPRLPEFIFRPFEREGRLENMVRQLYAEAFVSRGVYLYYRGGDVAEAENAWKTALRYDPRSEQARRLLGLSGANQGGGR
jgi:hypothetical protein